MSIFVSRSIACPACGAAVSFEMVHSVNADRRPDLRQAILARRFQRQECPACSNSFRLDPDFNYLDLARGQWIAAALVAVLGAWRQRESDTKALFARAYGKDAPDTVRALAERLRPRLTFGWPALREKLLIAAHGLDDIAVEACKATAMRGSEDLSFPAAADLRLLMAQKDRLVFAWQDNADAELGEWIAVSRALHDEIVADDDGQWQLFKTGFDGALFVDLARDLLATS